MTSDDFHVDPDELVELEAAGVIALDMETAAVAAVCEKHGCAWSVVRSISDMANDHPIGDDVMNLARPDGTANVPGVAQVRVDAPGQAAAADAARSRQRARGQERGRGRAPRVRAPRRRLTPTVRSVAT